LTGVMETRHLGKAFLAKFQVSDRKKGERHVRKNFGAALSGGAIRVKKEARARTQQKKKEGITRVS